MKPEDKAKVQQALEAMELNNDEWKNLADSGDCGYWKAEDQDHYKQTSEAIDGLRQLLERTEQEPAFYWDRDCFFVRPERAEFLGLDVDAMQALYTTPPAQPADLNLNCKSVQARLATQWGYVKAEPDEWPTGCPECGMDSGCDCDSGTWNPPAQPADHGDELTIAYLDGVHTGKQIAKREWVGLTDDDWQQIADETGYDIWSTLKQAVDAKLREKNGGA
jgi:hypothetical protein